MDDLLDSFEDLREQQEPGPSLMAQMEKRKQNEARNFTKGLLASMAAGDGAGSSSGGKTKRRSDGTASEEQSTSTSSKRTKQAADIAVKQEASAVEEVDMIERAEEHQYAGEADDYDQMVTAAPAMMAQQQRQQQQGNGGEEIEEEEDEEYRELREGPRINTFLVMSEDNCVHEAVFPIDREYTPLVQKTGDPAKTYEFPLDRFQKEAIKCLDNNQSVLVSAHTSAGKTVVALYAIALALRDKQRVIYTSPIKALSNQKYRELAEEFEDVGLVTGDVTLNPNASCVVMTTEILRSMLYRGTEVLREVGWVIFDEIHYMRDKERGVVWEETIILLPPNTHHVFLSATIPNAKQFAQWICYLYHQPCHVVYTDQRPVPLQHLIFPAGSDGLYEVVDPQGTFKEDNFAKAMQFLSDAHPAGDNVRPTNRRPIGGGDSNNKNVVKIIRTIMERDMLPCIIFSFSRKECELYATNVKQMDFNSEEEKRAIRLIFENAIDFLSDEDKKLPQIRNVLPYLLRGIGIHHSGQLPIMKEIVEILFGEGLIKTLFATETFAMGVNMPAKTVLFTSARKFDGTNNRWISSGEYIQMSGRAGRRGKDDRGLVILMMDQQMGADQAMQLVKGTSDPLNSQFRLTYNMVLNLLRVSEINPQFMLEKSFHQWQNYTQLPELMAAAHEKKIAMNNVRVEKETELDGLHKLEKRIDHLKQAIKESVMKPAKVVPFFHPGRMLKMKHFDKDYGWGVLINWRKTPNPLNPTSPDLIYIVEVAVLISRESERHLPNLSMVRPPADREKGALCIIPFTFDCIQAISTVRLKIPQELKSKDALETAALTLAGTKQRFANKIPELHPIEHMKIADPTVAKQLTELKESEDRYATHPLRKRPDFADLYSVYLNKLKLAEEYEQARKRVTDGKKLLQVEELQCRKRVLRRLGYATDEDIITDKGRVACELSSADELVLAEMLYSGVFSQLDAEETAALLSCFVFEERAPTAHLPDNLSGHLRNMQSQAKRIAKVSNECKLVLDEEKYLEGFGAGMMDVVYQWCRGASFAAIMDSTQLFEGSIIRCMRRLDELLQEMMTAAKAMKDETLVNKFEQARTLLKRDIVFSASLYL